MVVGVMLVPVGAVDFNLMAFLREEVPSRFPFELEALVPLVREQLPLELYDSSRMQYNAVGVNAFLYERYYALIREGFYLVGIVMADGFVEGLNFVFGLASPPMRVASVYLARMRLNGLDLLWERSLKVTVHELGHLFGLEHCSNPGCVMRFSNSLVELDEKGSRFCEVCRARLLELYKSGSIVEIGD